MIYPHKIESEEDVKIFFGYLIHTRELGIAFHPDTDLCDYININSREPIFKEAECRELKDKMDQCFWMQGIDMYQIGLDIVKPILIELSNK